ncbi:MAG: L,D-transpeptidase family protein [Myxococcota bacterium]
MCGLGLGLVIGLALLGPQPARASEHPPAELLPEFAYDVHLAPSVPSSQAKARSSTPPASPTTGQLPAPASSTQRVGDSPAAIAPRSTIYAPWTADLVRVYKAERRLVLFAGNQPIDEFQIALGSRPIGPKRQKGDGRTPEGRYRIDWRKTNSDFFRALHISYPNDRDRRFARDLGVSPGGSIMIHGLPNGLGMIGEMHVLSDWTDGCIAVTNEEILQLWDRIPDGIPIEILP